MPPLVLVIVPPLMNEVTTGFISECVIEPPPEPSPEIATPIASASVPPSSSESTRMSPVEWTPFEPTIASTVGSPEPFCWT